MLDALTQFFDTYSLRARVMPAFFLSFSAIVTVLAWNESAQSSGGLVVSLLLTCGVLSFVASQLSTFGNSYQKRLFSKLGAAPTTIMLRFEDDQLDRLTKARYQNFLAEIVNGYTPMTPEREKSDRKSADQVYNSAVNYLREHTRDTKKYPLVFKENVAYGFSRNLRAIKGYGIFISLLVLVLNLLLIWNSYVKPDSEFDLNFLFAIPAIHLGAVGVSVCMVFVWIFSVRSSWVTVRAFAYARALLATCESIEKT